MPLAASRFAALHLGMDLPKARELIESALRRMEKVYLQPVFNEWAVLSLTPRPGVKAAVVAYQGPRVENFQDSVRRDAAPLCALASKPIHEGDFEFALDAQGTHLDAFMKIGPASYLVCNHTGKSLNEIRADPLWIKVQADFFALGERFRADPLV